MGMKKSIKKCLFKISSGYTDLLYRRPYLDKEAKLRRSLEGELLHLDLVITECCSLKCRDCSNLMQYYQKPENLTSDEVINELKKLFSCLRVRELKVLGGEPFVNQKVLSDVLRFLTGDYSGYVDSINIITNGTILPSEDCLEAMISNPKAKVSFSNYGELSNRQDEFVELCKKNNIDYLVTDDSFYWLDFGRPIEYNESEDFVRRQYKYCYNRKNCNTLYRGRIYACPRQAHGIRLGLIPDSKDEFVDLFDPGYTDKDDLRRAIIGLVRRKEPVSACRYCLNCKYIHIKRGIQEKR